MPWGSTKKEKGEAAVLFGVRALCASWATPTIVHRRVQNIVDAGVCCSRCFV